MIDFTDVWSVDYMPGSFMSRAVFITLFTEPVTHIIWIAATNGSKNDFFQVPAWAGWL